MRRFLTEDEINYIKENYLEMGARKIAEKLDVHETTVWGYGRKFKLTGLQKKEVYRFTPEQCEFINNHYKNKRLNLRKIGHMLNDKFGLNLSEKEFKYARSRAILEGQVETRNSSGSNSRSFSHSSAYQLKAQSHQIKFRLTGGCHMCGAPSDGKYCAEHIRVGFPQDMSSPRGAEDLVTFRRYA